MAEGEFALAKTSVWWDIENCAVPRGFDAHNIAKNISAALANEGYGGMVTSIYAYGDTNKINTSVQHALNSTGVNLNHVPAGVKDAADKKMLVDMLIWAVDNARPANFLLISGDRDFSNALHQLRMRRYNILLAHAPNMSQALVAAAKCVWLWSSLVAGGPSRNADSSLKSGATDTDSGNSSEGIEQTQNAHGNGNPTKAPQRYIPHRPRMQDKRNGTPENNNVKANEKQQTDQVSAIDQVSEAHGNVQSKNNAGTVATPVPSGDLEQTQNAHENGNHVDRQPVKLTSKAPQRYIPPNLRMQDKTNGSREKKNIKSNEKKQADQVSSTDQVSEAHGNGQSKNNAGNVVAASVSSASFSESDKEMRSFKSAPHKFYANNSAICTGPMASTISSTSSEFPSNSCNDQARPGPALRPNEKNRTQPPFAPPGNLRASSSLGNTFYPQRGTNRPPFGIPPQQPQAERPPFCGPFATPPDISRLNRSEHPIGIQQPISHQHNPEMRPRFSGTPHNSNPAQNFGHFPPGRHEYPAPPAINGNTYCTGFSGGQAFPEPTPEIQFHIDTILHALNILRMDKMAPTETNIGDCILFGETKHPNFNVRLGLDYAMRHGTIVKQSLGYSLPLYIPKNDRLWNCVNIMDANERHPKKIWDTVQKYMSSPTGRGVLLHTTCRYEAAVVLKTNCFKDFLPLGIVLQILQLTIVAKKWVVPHSSGWQPIAINLPPSQMK